MKHFQWYIPAMGIMNRVEEGDFDEFGEMPGIVLHDCPWAECCLEADGGLIAFESYQDFLSFKKSCD